jgi:hypothetical protein
MQWSASKSPSNKIPAAPFDLTQPWANYLSGYCTKRIIDKNGTPALSGVLLLRISLYVNILHHYFIDRLQCLHDICLVWTPKIQLNVLVSFPAADWCDSHKLGNRVF